MTLDWHHRAENFEGTTEKIGRGNIDVSFKLFTSESAGISFILGYVHTVSLALNWSQIEDISKRIHTSGYGNIREESYDDDFVDACGGREGALLL